MAEGSMGDRLLNKVIERAQLWAEVKDDDSVQDGKIVMRKRKSFLEARKEVFDYTKALERTVRELEGQNERLHGELANSLADVRRLSVEIEQRNRTIEKGPDQIGMEYIQRLGIPELTEVFNRLVLGR